MLTKVPPPLLDAPLIGMANRIINGNFSVLQRGNVYRADPDTALYCADRWYCRASAPASFNFSSNNSSGRTSLVITPITLDAAPTADKLSFFQQRIEGWNVADIQFGRGGNARPFVLVFDVIGAYANLVGQSFPVSFRNAAGTLSYVSSFTINAVNDIETKVIVVPPTTGFNPDFNYDTGIGLYVDFGLCVGSTYHAPSLNQWLAGNYLGHASMFNFLGQNDAALLFRNFRLYPGIIDLGEDQRTFAEELRLCQRYYQSSFSYGTGPGTGTSENRLSGRVYFAGQLELDQFASRLSPPMRAAPTMTWHSTATGNPGKIRNISTAADLTVTTSANQGPTSTGYPTIGAAGTSGFDQIAAHFTASAEL